MTASHSAVIIQARMGSSRLPGKVLMELAGEPMLLHVVRRCRAASLPDRVIVATSTGTPDDEIEKFCRAHAIDCFRGSELDVLERYCGAAEEYGVELVTRVTADCPLIDPEVIDRTISAYLEERPECAGASNVLQRTFPRGLDVEVIPFRTLSAVRKLASLPAHREHVTKYLYDHLEDFRLVSVTQDADLSGMRWTVDEERDFRFASEVYARLYAAGQLFSTRQVLALLTAEPWIGAINQDVRQKAL